MPPAARVGDATAHPGIITGPGVASVVIGGMAAAVAGDTHTCSAAHPAGPFTSGCPTVLIGDRPALRIGDAAPCGSLITGGATDVVVGG